MSGKFLKNVGWMGGTELVIRVSRLLVVVVLGRLLSPHDYGLAAIVLTVNDFVDVLTRNGITAKLIQAPKADLPKLCNTAYWLTWIVAALLFVIQCVAGVAAGWIYSDHTLVLPICALALIYPMLPLAQVRSALIQRENRLEVSALSVSLQVVVNAVLTVIFALLGWGMWAIVAPKVLVAPIWVAVNRANHTWKAPRTFDLSGWQAIAQFGRNILGVEMLNTLRQNLDYLLVGPFLGVEQLGVYYFAFNAGLGLSLSAINALSQSLYPHLCEDPDQLPQRFTKALKAIACIIVPLVILQATLAPTYIPLVFGAKWASAVPLAVLICLSAIPRPFARAASQVLWVRDRAHLDFWWECAFTVCFAIAILAGLPWGLIGIATAVLAVHWIVLPLFTYGVTRYVVSSPRAARLGRRSYLQC
ncbi:MAG: lipopolysaccharide biosynthesis protein [Cyanobacteria bacterium J06639_1]